MSALPTKQLGPLSLFTSNYYQLSGTIQCSHWGVRRPREQPSNVHPAISSAAHINIDITCAGQQSGH